MKAVRYVSEEELFILVAQGVINAETAPFAVIGANENLKDTSPRPQNGTVMFFEDTREFYPYDMEYYTRISVNIPDEFIGGRHTGVYIEWSQDYDGNHYIFDTHKMDEISTFELRLEWVTGVRVTIGSDWAILSRYPQFCGDDWIDYNGIWKADIARVRKENPNFSENKAMAHSDKISCFGMEHEEEIATTWQKIKDMVTIFR